MDIDATGTGHGDAAAQDAFCGNGPCTISIVYDQSGEGNHLEPSPPGSAKSTSGNPVVADGLPTTIGGHAAYGMRFVPGMGYRAGCDECTPLRGPEHPRGRRAGDHLHGDQRARGP